MKKNNKNNKTALFVLLSYAKGVVHATAIPYILLWVFHGLGLKAVAVSALYVFAVGTLYRFSESHDLSGRAFFATLKFLLGATLVFGSIILIGSQQ